MRGLMMDDPLLITRIMQFAERNFPDSQIVSLTADAEPHRCSYGEAFSRARRLANALARLDARPGDRVGTLAWNDHRHFEIYYGSSCSGAVCHTINPRLFPDQIAYIAGHAEDRWIFADPMFAPLLEGLAAQLPRLERVVFLCGPDQMPDTALPGAIDYETLIGAETDDFEWPQLDETCASALCYTSGTTGHPKGVLYHHRSTVLHAYAACMPDCMNLANRDTVMAIVPMFHASAWSLPYACPMVGAHLVLPGPRMGDPEALTDLIRSERVSCSMGVPTVWLGLLQYLEESGREIPSLERIVVGGAACPPMLIEAFEKRHDVRVHHSWGMTEMSPLGVFNSPTRVTEYLAPARRESLAVKQGRGVFGVEMRIVDDGGEALPWDGESPGRLQVRGPWVCSGYFRSDDDPGHGADGWFDTGDVATIDPLGFMQITDRAKDVIKSGGEWISSIELENLALDHPGVAEAAVISIPHPKWSERPLLLIVTRPGETVDPDELLAGFEGKVASWWIPDGVSFVDELPHTATGKLAKARLRRQFADYRWPDDGREQ
ncbi:MAG: long-chain-fatty-acid--CoA ligase [Gammaproteobacteria bacterium]|jgi:fatty-acyl-CoA synthase